MTTLIKILQEYDDYEWTAYAFARHMTDGKAENLHTYDRIARQKGFSKPVQRILETVAEVANKTGLEPWEVVEMMLNDKLKNDD